MTELESLLQFSSNFSATVENDAKMNESRDLITASTFPGLYGTSESQLASKRQKQKSNAGFWDLGTGRGGLEANGVSCLPAAPKWVGEPHHPLAQQLCPSSVQWVLTLPSIFFSLPPFPTPWENKVGMKACTHLITSLNYQLHNTWTWTRHADGWLPLLILFYFYCLARASSFKSWIIRTETLRYFSQINPWPIDTLLYLTKHTTLLFPDNFSINCFSALIRYKVRLWLGLYIPISYKLSWSPNQLQLGF